jgi:hypothetical protein
MLTPGRKRVLKPHQRRVLVLLAGCGAEGCVEAVIRAREFTADQLAQLGRIGFIAKTTLSVVSSGQTSEVTRGTGRGRSRA